MQTSLDSFVLDVVHVTDCESLVVRVPRLDPSTISYLSSFVCPVCHRMPHFVYIVYTTRCYSQ